MARIITFVLHDEATDAQARQAVEAAMRIPAVKSATAETIEPAVWVRESQVVNALARRVMAVFKEYGEWGK